MNIYEKFKNNNLPTPFWDEKRKTLEYVNVGTRKTIFNFDKAENKIEIYTNLTEALENIADVSFYYPFKAKYQTITKEGPKFVVGKTHSHSFEGVVLSYMIVLNLLAYPKRKMNFTVTKNLNI